MTEKVVPTDKQFPLFARPGVFKMLEHSLPAETITSTGKLGRGAGADVPEGKTDCPSVGVPVTLDAEGAKLGVAVGL